MNITVTHTLSPEILNLLQGFVQNQNGGSLPPAAATSTKVKPIKADTAGNNGSSSSSASTEEVTIEQVRAAVQAKAQGGKRDEVKTLLTEFGATKVTELDKSKYADFLTKVNAL